MIPSACKCYKNGYKMFAALFSTQIICFTREPKVYLQNFMQQVTQNKKSEFSAKNNVPKMIIYKKRQQLNR